MATSLTMQIRIADESDADTLFAIRTSVQENHQSVAELAALGVTPAAIASMLQTTCRAWIAEVGGHGVAFAMADGQLGTVFALFVHPAFEGQHLGSRLLHRAETWLFAQGWDEVWLTTGVDHTLRAHGFYQRQGWQSDGFAGDDELRYRKRNPQAASLDAD